VLSIRRAIDGFDKFNERLARVLCYALVVIMCIQVMDVVLRFFFNNPTIWAMDLNTMTFTGICFLAGGYALLHDTHVRLDILSRTWSPKTGTIIRLCTFPLVMIAICFVIWKGFDSFWWAVKTNQHGQSYWAPPLWPVKLFLPLGAILLLLQGLSKWLRLFLSLKNPLPDDQKGETA
jgi:TRAP-type mannitol/chloroaromatic compound transport system permease small subunit